LPVPDLTALADDRRQDFVVECLCGLRAGDPFSGRSVNIGLDPEHSEGDMVLLGDRNIWLLACFAVFVVSILLFAVAYYFIYRSHPMYFLVNADVQDAQREFFRNTAAADIELLASQVEALEYLRRPDAPRPTLSNYRAYSKWVDLGSDRRFRLREVLVPVRRTKRVMPVPALALEVADATGKAGSMLLPTHSGNWREDFRTLREDRQIRIARLQRRLETVDTETPDIWSYWDFVYFSAITQTTVGFGDILPNATLVRKFVVGQILWSYVIILVLLNAVFIR
jgi:hypothetical protein